MTDHSERDEANWRKVRDKLAGDWFKDWDDRLNREELRPLFSAYRHEREEATRHFDAGWSSAIANDPRVHKLVEAAEMVCKYPDSEGCFDELHEALTEWSKP